MKLPTPRWWYVREGRPAPVGRTLLKPVSWLWAWATARRIARATPVDVGVPVICVGGLTVGGTGKTPVARALLARLRAEGIDTHALTRGYGGTLRGPVRVDPDRHGAEQVGDEPLLLARDAPVWVARDRVAGARAAAAAGAEAIVMDDGHQNPALSKALSLVVVDGETRNGEWPFGDGAVFPSGPLREPLATGLGRADAMVVLLPADLSSPDPELVLQLRAPRRKPGPIPSRQDQPAARQPASAALLIARLEPTAPPPPGPQLAFAGIGKPWRFEQALRAAGAELADFAAFPDHAPFAEADLRALADQADVLGAGLLTTEKDWVRLPPAWRSRVKSWPVRARFEDEAALGALLRQALASATRAR